MVITDDERLCSYLFNKKITYKLHSSLPAEIFIERLDNKVIDSKFFKQVNTLTHCREQLQVIVVGLKDHARVRKKSQHHTFSFFFSCNFAQSRNDPLVSCMHAVESADGGYTMFQRTEFFDALVDNHQRQK